jgi:hypothetical protein
MVKTGTTNDRRDNWTLGGNDNAMVGVWVGNNDNSPMLNVASGVSGASPIWRRIVLESLKGKADKGFEIPGNIVTAEVDSVSGYRAHDGFPSRTEYFAKGTEPDGDPVHVNLKVCKSEGKLANPGDVASGNYDNREFFIFKEEDPTSGAGGQNRWQEGIINWLNGQSDSKYHPPTDYCGTSNPINIEFVNPHDHDSNLPNNFTIKFSADSTNDIVQADLYIDGVKVRSFSSVPYEHPVNLSDGVHTIRATATDTQNHTSERIITVGVHTNWDNPLPSL